jgi:hypothetical protein
MPQPTKRPASLVPVGTADDDGVPLCKKRAPFAYKTKPGPKPKPQDGDAGLVSASAAVNATPSKKRLTMGDWESVFRWMEEHQVTQVKTVSHFSKQITGCLVFTQAALSNVLKQQPNMQALIEANPANILRACPCIVTNPKVEKVLLVTSAHHSNLWRDTNVRSWQIQAIQNWGSQRKPFGAGTKVDQGNPGC